MSGEQLTLEAALAGRRGHEMPIPGERRAAPRFPVDVDAVIEGRHGEPDIACTILDVSQSGMRLRTDPGVCLPDVFTVRIEQRNLKAGARLMWRGETLAGVQTFNVTEYRLS